jgi:DNA-directed RNA polymerase subunit L
MSCRHGRPAQRGPRGFSPWDPGCLCGVCGCLARETGESSGKLVWVPVLTRQIPPTIRSLWASDQLYLFKSSLCYLASSCGAITAEGLEEDTTLQRLLADVLFRSNVSEQCGVVLYGRTHDKLLRPDIQVDALDDVDRVIDVPWQLRQKAADRISSRPLAVSPMSTTSASPVSPSPSPSVSVPGWWHG